MVTRADSCDGVNPLVSEGACERASYRQPQVRAIVGVVVSIYLARLSNCWSSDTSVAETFDDRRRSTGLAAL